MSSTSKFFSVLTHSFETRETVICLMLYGPNRNISKTSNCGDCYSKPFIKIPQNIM